jgi:hypothetical protein
MTEIKNILVAVLILAVVFAGGVVTGYFIPREKTVVTTEITRVVTNDIIRYGTNTVSISIGTNRISDKRGEYEVYSNAFSNFVWMLD